MRSALTTEGAAAHDEMHSGTMTSVNRIFPARRQGLFRFFELKTRQHKTSVTTSKLIMIFRGYVNKHKKQKPSLLLHLADAPAADKAASSDASIILDAPSASPSSRHTTPRFPSATAWAPQFPGGAVGSDLTVTFKGVRLGSLATGSCRSSTSRSKCCFASWWCDVRGQPRRVDLVSLGLGAPVQVRNVE